MGDQQMETGHIKNGDAIANEMGRVEFVMDKACSVKFSDLFHREQTTNKIEFKVVDTILDLTCLDGLRKKSGSNECLLPKKIFVRKYLQYALERRLQYDQHPTVLFGSPGVGKSVFAFLAAIAMAFTERHKAVLYARRVGDRCEASSLFWMTKGDNETVDIVACRAIGETKSISSVCNAIARVFFNGAINMSNTPTSYGIKIIVDGPRYEEKRERPGGSDLVVTGDCPPPAEPNTVWHFPINAWTFDELALALKSLKMCSRSTAEKIYDTTGGCIRLAVWCCSESGGVDGATMKRIQSWMQSVVEWQGNHVVVELAYSHSKLSDNILSMIVREAGFGTRPFFETRQVLASPHIARLMWSKTSLDQLHRAMIYAQSTGDRSLFDWYFELWGHKLSEQAIDAWRQRTERPAARPIAAMALGQEVGSYFRNGEKAVTALTSKWLYWKPNIPNFASIDSAILLGDGTLVCLQFTVMNEHYFDLRSFLLGFVLNIPEDVRSNIQRIKVLFVVPNDVTFSAVRIPLEQRDLFESHYSENSSAQVSRPLIKYVKPNVAALPENVPETGNNQPDMMEDVVPYDESLDGGWFSVDSAMNVDVTLEVEFETRAVALDSNPDPFFDLPSVSLTEGNL